MKTKPLAQQFKNILTAHYGDRLADLILFGSYARGNFHDESDIDFALILNDNQISAAKEIIDISEMVANLNLQYGVVVSVLPVAKNRLLSSSLPVYRAIRTEGIKI